MVCSSMGGRIMIPRIFISSTFFDLRYAREDLGNFVRGYNFEPIMFEHGDIGYLPGEKLDESCYQAMRSADMVILIIGGKYGSMATSEMPENEFSEYLSITRKEYNTALSENIPVYVFIESDVLSEYNIYKKNKTILEKNPESIKFNATDNINIFRFISNILILGKISVTDFKETQQIKDFLRKQWADLFKKYLTDIKQKRLHDKMESSVEQIERIMQSMKIMLQYVGQKVTGNDEETYDIIVQEQKKTNLANSIANSFEFLSTLKNIDEVEGFLCDFVKRLFSAYEEGILINAFSDDINDLEIFYDYFVYDKVILINITSHVEFEIDKCKEWIKNTEFQQQIVELLMEENFLLKMNLLIRK